VSSGVIYCCHGREEQLQATPAGVIQRGGAVNNGSTTHGSIVENTADLIARKIAPAGELQKLRKRTASIARTIVGGGVRKKKKEG
jgi:hypothetical protein